jgi:hypothetical protein
VLEVLDDAGALAEGEALVAFSLAGRDAAAAREAWARYLSGPGGKGPWGTHARASAEGPRRESPPEKRNVVERKTKGP